MFIAEEADGDPVGLLVAEGERRTGGERQMSADDPVAAVEATLGVEEVHRAPLPFRDPGPLAEQLGHHRARITAEHQHVRMVAISGVDDVVGAEGGEDSGDDGLLSCVDVEVTADLSAAELPLGRLFEPPDQQHLPEQIVPLRRTCFVCECYVRFFFFSRHQLTSEMQFPGDRALRSTGAGFYGKSGAQSHHTPPLRVNDA
jgi:hypothetical protein